MLRGIISIAPQSRQYRSFFNYLIFLIRYINFATDASGTGYAVQVMNGTDTRYTLEVHRMCVYNYTSPLLNIAEEKKRIEPTPQNNTKRTGLKVLELERIITLEIMVVFSLERLKEELHTITLEKCYQD